MKGNFFIKNLLLFLLPLLIPVLILGSLSILITQNHIKEQITENNMNTLSQTKTSIDLIFSEIDTLNIQIDSSSKPALNLKRVLQSDNLNASDLDNIDMISFFINSFANTKPYIYSIYVYYENDSGRFYTTNKVIENFNTFYDNSWYEKYKNHPSDERLWIEKRNIKQYDFEDKETRLITVYKKMAQNNGVIVLNLKADYIEDLLNKSAASPEQKIFILDKKNDELMKSDPCDDLSDFNINQLLNTDSNRIYSSKENKYLIKSLIKSERFAWNYVSIIPEETLYQVSTRLIKYTIIFLVVSLVLGVLLTFYLTRKRYKQINNIISIIDSAKNHQPLPIIEDKNSNEFTYIIENLITAFIEQNYLKLQLSERKYKLENMELIALQSQINPHFLFNTLHTIYWEVIKIGGYDCKPIKMIENLSSILDYSLTTPTNTVSMDNEIRYTKTYLEIQITRYADKFEVIWDYSDDIKDVSTIKLLIQPLVENCIHHGINNKTTEEKGKIKIRISTNNNLVFIAIIDNGAGIEADKLKEIQSKLHSSYDSSNHIGLFNTNKRLKITYGDDYGIHINSRFGLGTVIYIRFPISYN